MMEEVDSTFWQTFLCEPVSSPLGTCENQESNLLVDCITDVGNIIVKGGEAYLGASNLNSTSDAGTYLSQPSSDGLAAVRKEVFKGDTNLNSAADHETCVLQPDGLAEENAQGGEPSSLLPVSEDPPIGDRLSNLDSCLGPQQLELTLLLCAETIVRLQCVRGSMQSLPRKPFQHRRRVSLRSRPNGRFTPSFFMKDDEGHLHWYGYEIFSKKWIRVPSSKVADEIPPPTLPEVVPDDPEGEEPFPDDILGRNPRVDAMPLWSELSETLKILPSPDPHLFKDHLVAGARDLLCINIGKSPGREELVVFDLLTQGVLVLPPRNYARHPMLMHLMVDADDRQYKVIVAGSAAIGTEELSRKTEEYDSRKGVWECPDGSDLPYGLNEYQNGVYFKDSERELLLCVARVDTSETGLLAYDIKKKKWTPVPLQPHIPGRAGTSGPNISIPVALQIVECGGSVFVFSEEECDRGKNCLLHSLQPEGSADFTWHKIWQHKTTGGRGLRANPEFYVVWGSDHELCIFHTIEKTKETIDILGIRQRRENWTTKEIDLLLESMGQFVVEFSNKPPWMHISQSLEKNGFKRSPKSCEGRWGTLLKGLDEIQVYVQSEDTHPDTSSWSNIWTMDEYERSQNKLPPVFTLGWYQMMETIHDKKPRKKIGGKKQRSDAIVGASSSSITNNPTVASRNSSGILDASNPSPSAPPVETSLSKRSISNSDVGQGDEQRTEGEAAVTSDLLSEMTSLCDLLLQGGQDWTNKQRLEILKESNKRAKLQLEILKLQEKRKGAGSANHRLTKVRKGVHKQT